MGKRLIGAALAAVLAAGCQPEAQACASVMGNYEATFTYAGGNCLAMQGSAGPFDMTSDQTTATVMQMRVDDMITTEIIKTGCTVNVARVATKENITLWRFEGELDVESADTLSGPMERWEWNNGMQVCQGTYNTVMKKVPEYNPMQPVQPPPMATF